jgi:hypothetical protein
MVKTEITQAYIHYTIRQKQEFEQWPGATHKLYYTRGCGSDGLTSSHSVLHYHRWETTKVGEKITITFLFMVYSTIIWYLSQALNGRMIGE